MIKETAYVTSEHIYVVIEFNNSMVLAFLFHRATYLHDIAWQVEYITVIQITAEHLPTTYMDSISVHKYKFRRIVVVLL